jgi:hypothetical protein
LVDFQVDLHLIFDNSLLYNTPDTVYHRTAVRLKRAAAPMIDEAKKIESSLVYNDQRSGNTLDMKELEPIEGWEYSSDPWPGCAVRDMSPLSSIGDEDVKQMEKELIDERMQQPEPGTPEITSLRRFLGGSSRSHLQSRRRRG